MANRRLLPTHVDHPAVGHERSMSWVVSLARDEAGQAYLLGPNPRTISESYARSAAQRMLEVSDLPKVKDSESLLVVGVEYFLRLEHLAQQFPEIQVAAAELFQLRPLAFNLRFLPSTEAASHTLRSRIEQALLRAFDKALEKPAPISRLDGIAQLLSTASEISDLESMGRLYIYETLRARPERAQRLQEEFVAFHPDLAGEFDSFVASVKHGDKTDSLIEISSKALRVARRGAFEQSKAARRVMKRLLESVDHSTASKTVSLNIDSHRIRVKYSNEGVRSSSEGAPGLVFPTGSNFARFSPIDKTLAHGEIRNKHAEVDAVVKGLHVVKALDHGHKNLAEGVNRDTS